MESPKKLRIALDAMGGDYAPEREVAGAIEALRLIPDQFEVILVGDEKSIRQQLEKQNVHHLPLSVVHASQVITMEDSPTAALKHKKDSSVAVGMRLHHEGHADACVSAGNTGAVLSAATLILGRIKNVSRPTIGTFIPAEHGSCLLVDAGANVDCRAQQLYEFAVMGSIYVQLLKKKDRPAIGLLNVGEEKSKGSEAAQEAHKLLSESAYQFIGNVEGGDILKSKADVVVCDGFVGNIVLKFAESVPSFLKGRLKKFSARSVMNKLAVGLSLWPLKAALHDMDPNIEGGVPVLGVNGVAIIGHGSSTVLGIRNMILRAAEVAQSQVNRQIEAALAEKGI
ncbi:MAG: phosphate acyltransferase PlsX [Ignavibacteriae bacterium]|nr:MAG: phosphate acyltransferase PlsX [Ignavibacteriota bacterium]